MKTKPLSQSVTHPVSRQPTHEEIAACARQIWEREGRPEGRAQEHWLQAEAQVFKTAAVTGNQEQKKRQANPIIV